MEYEIEHTAASPRRLQGQTALVTGAGRGIGEAIARRFADEGASVGVFDVLGDHAEQVASELRAAGGAAVGVAGDVSERADVAAAVAAVEDALGPISIVVNCAAICPTAPLLDVGDDLVERMMAVNVQGPLTVVQETAKRMIDGGGGRIVNVTSMSAARASSGQSVYAASKAALEALNRAMAHELGPHGITVNAVAPGVIITPLNLETLSEADRALRLPRIPLGRFGEASEIAGAVAFLASPDASYVNGAVLLVDGGHLISGTRDDNHVRAAPR